MICFVFFSNKNMQVDDRYGENAGLLCDKIQDVIRNDDGDIELSECPHHSHELDGDPRYHH